MSKSISPMLLLKKPGTKLFPASPRPHRSDEFAASYSLAVCSPAWPASASPAGFHLQAAGSYLSTVSFGKISKLDSKARTRQNINIRGGPNQSDRSGPGRRGKKGGGGGGGGAGRAVKENQTHIRYLEALLQVESEERDRHAIANRTRDAQLPRMKTLEEFDFAQAPKIPAAKIRELAQGGYIERSEPVVLIGECGTGKSHLATGLCLEACRQKRRVRFTTAAALVNELVEAKHNNQVRRMMARWQRYELIAVDEVGYVPLADVGAEFLFQVT